MISVRRAVLIVNVHSRKGEALYADACAALSALRITFEPFAVRDPATLGDVVRHAVAGRPDVLILGGGDGTISSVVDHLVGSEVPLGLLPLGTANSFARSLGLPIDLDEAVNMIAAGHVRRVDLGKIDGDYFANCAAIGMSPLIATTIPKWLKKLGGRFGYLLWAAIQFLRLHPFRLTLGEGAEAVSYSAVEVRIANGSFQGGTELIEAANVDSGEIVVQIVEGQGRWQLAKSWLLSLLKRHEARLTMRDFHAKSIRIDADPPQTISIDGEVLARTPVIASIAPGIVNVIAPPPWYRPGDD